MIDFRVPMTAVPQVSFVGAVLVGELCERVCRPKISNEILGGGF
jgi:hypothetical protein